MEVKMLLMQVLLGISAFMGKSCVGDFFLLLSEENFFSHCIFFIVSPPHPFARLVIKVILKLQRKLTLHLPSEKD